MGEGRDLGSRDVEPKGIVRLAGKWAAVSADKAAAAAAVCRGLDEEYGGG